MRRKLDTTDKHQALRAVPLLASCTDKELDGIAALTTEVGVHAGQKLCERGAAGVEFFVLLEGTAEVAKSSGAVIEVGAGEFFGELALLDGGPRTATVTMRTDGRVLALSGPEFRELLRATPEIAIRMLSVLGARMRAGEQAPTDG